MITDCPFLHVCLALVGRRLAASLASTGTPAHFTHASEWAHGDLGNAETSGGRQQQQEQERKGDVVITLSHSGSTPEVVEAVRLLKQRGLPVFAITSSARKSSSSCSSSESPPPSPLVALLANDDGVGGGSGGGGVLEYALPSGAVEPFGGAPTCSIVAMESLANALVVAVAQKKRFNQPLFKRNHPGGALGLSL